MAVTLLAASPAVISRTPVTSARTGSVTAMAPRICGPDTPANRHKNIAARFGIAGVPAAALRSSPRVAAARRVRNTAVVLVRASISEPPSKEQGTVAAPAPSSKGDDQFDWVGEGDAGCKSKIIY